MLGLYDAILMLGYAIGTVGGVLSLKYALPGLQAGMQTWSWQPLTLLAAAVGIVLYFGGALIWMVILARNELSIVYPIAVGVTVFTTTVAAVVLFGEAVTFLRVLGCALVILAVVLIARG